MMQKKAGFSMLELMITLGIIAILTAVITPNIINWLKSQGLRSAISELHGNLQQAKLSAIRQNQSCTVNFNTINQSYNISCVNKSVLLESYGGGVVFGGPSGETTANSITFTSKGICSINGSVYLADQDNSAYYRIQTFNSGGITTSKWDGSNWP